jgi:uncharacterized protein (TIGR00369 family)
MEPAILRQVMEELIPFNKFLGIRVERIERGIVKLELPFRDELIGDPLKRALHGGVLSTLADVAGGAAAWSAIDDPMARVSTIDLRVDYLRPGRAHAVIAEAAVVRLGGRIAVTDMKMFHPGGESEPVATGRGVYAVKVPKQAPRSAG